MNPFDNAVALITGAASGIGRSLVIQAVNKGAYVIATDRNEKGLADTAGLTKADRVETHSLDVADPDAILAFAEKIIPTLAGRRLLLVNNAGVALASGPFADTTLDEFEWLLSINLWGVIRMTKAFLPYLLEHKGHIVNVSSVFGLAGVMNQSAYCTAKFGVRGFTETLRMELMDTGIGVTTVHPGGIDTNIARNARLGASGLVTEAMRKKGAVSFEKAAKTTAHEAARQIWAGVETGKVRVVIGADGRLLDRLTRLFPSGYTKMIKKQIEAAFDPGVS